MPCSSHRRSPPVGQGLHPAYCRWLPRPRSRPTVPRPQTPSCDQNASHRSRCRHWPCPAAAGGREQQLPGRAGGQWAPHRARCAESRRRWGGGNRDRQRQTRRAPEPPQLRTELRRRKRRRRRAVSDGAQRQQQRGLREASLLPAAITVTRPLHILI